MNCSIANVQFKAQDDYPLRGMYYACKKPKAQIVLASATGVPQGFYQRYAFAANASGFNVLTFDYRGIGQSKPRSLKGFEMDYLDWGRMDLAAAINTSYEYHLPMFVVGHSYGGHAVGLLPNHHLIQGAYVFGAGAGWSGWMPVLERAKVEFMWRVIAPVIVKQHGYLAWNKLGMGEDLPKNVYRQWKHWCKNPHYFFDDASMQHMHEVYARFDKPLVAANATDDKWAMPRSRDAFFKFYTNADLRVLDINPQSIGVKRIDHMGYFKRFAQPLWQNTFEWIETLVKKI
uniref:alpha/beta hydrolase family protein n=1 Tax=Ningiella ruwaisensis TaxID=2364274 RepID=UPI0010A0A424|nr:alpha/beta fold hydrolase [Ningiella ruwaisensis]